jgi:hypothetical protein
LKNLLWPDVRFYREQRDIIDSVWDNDETICVAGNMLGKDFTAAFIALAFFLTRHPCRVVTTSVDGSQLQGVLWGEMRRFIQTSRFPLDTERGGPLLINHMHMRKVLNGEVCGISYIIGRVAAKGEGLQGHHVSPLDLRMANDGVPRTLAIGDEASGLDDEDYRMMSTWAKRKLFIGNPWPTSNFFKRAVKGDGRDPGGDVQRLSGVGYRRRVLRIKAEDSPNIKLARKEEAAGIKPTGLVIVPGVKEYYDYMENRRLWDPMQQCVSLDADFYEGVDVRMYPPEWLNTSEQLHEKLRGSVRKAEAIGVDPAEGGDDTALYAVDRSGVVDREVYKTPDTSIVPGLIVAFGRKHGVPAHMWMVDRGGGGKEHVDRLVKQGHKGIRSIGFGEGVSLELKRGLYTIDTRKDVQAERYAYKNRRAEMYHELRLLMDPAEGGGFAIPREYVELRRQLSAVPLWRDGEGRVYLPPKKARSWQQDDELTMEKVLGCSPDESDALVLAVHAMLYKSRRVVAGAVGRRT